MESQCIYPKAIEQTAVMARAPTPAPALAVALGPARPGTLAVERHRARSHGNQQPQHALQKRGRKIEVDTPGHKNARERLAKCRRNKKMRLAM